MKISDFSFLQIVIIIVLLLLILIVLTDALLYVVAPALIIYGIYYLLTKNK